MSENKFLHLFCVTEELLRFPEPPEIIQSKGLEFTACRQSDYLSELEKFIQTMRA